MIYFIVFAILLTFAIIFDYRYAGTLKSKSSAYAVIFSFLILTLLAGLRYRVGTDTLTYMDDYYNQPIGYFNDKYLFGWNLLIAACRSLNCDFYIVQLILAAFTNFAVISFLRKHANHFFSALLLYYVILYPGLNFEILRQAVCISIFLLSFSFLEKKSFVKYYICALVACLFHLSAIVLLFLPLLLWIPLNKKAFRIFLGIGVFTIICSTLLKDQIYKLSMGLSFLSDRAFYYFSQVDAEESFSLVSYLFNLTLNAIIPFLVIRFHLYSKKISKAFILCSMLSILIYIVSIYMPIIYRINDFFLILNLILFVDLFNWIRSRFVRRPYVIMLVCLLCLIGVKSRVYFADDEGTPVYYHYYPYSSIFNEFKVEQREMMDM